LPQEQARRRTAADRSPHRPEPAAVEPADALESAGLARRPRQPAGDPHGTWTVVRGADLPAVGAQSDAGAAHRRPRAAGSSVVRTDVRSRAGGTVRPVASGRGGTRGTGSIGRTGR